MELNYYKMGMKAKGEDSEWYTIALGCVLSIHVNNFSRDDWQCKVTGLQTKIKNGFATKEAAAAWGYELAEKLLNEALTAVAAGGK